MHTSIVYGKGSSTTKIYLHENYLLHKIFLTRKFRDLRYMQWLDDVNLAAVLSIIRLFSGALENLGFHAQAVV